MSLEAWGDEGFDIPDGYMTVERCQEIHAELQAERDEYKGALLTMETRYRKLDDALAKAVEVIKQWHNMGGGEDVWQIYYNNAPEMKLIREALTRSTDRRE